MRFRDKGEIMQHYLYYLDTLTDGSEHTGHGTVFFTVSRQSNHYGKKTTKAADTSINHVSQTSSTPFATGLKNNNHTSFSSSEASPDTILARYALTGLSTLTSRLAADQTFKLSSIRAVLCPLRDVPSITGIPSLLLALSNYSLTGKVHIIGPMGITDYTDTMADLVLGRKRVYPKILTCDVPIRIKQNDHYYSWWKVYEDEYIMIHARMHVEENDDQKEVIYIVTTKGIDQFSFVILPPKLNLSKTSFSHLFHPLPAEIIIDESQSSMISENDHTQNNIFHFFLHIDPSGSSISDTKSLLNVEPSIAKLTKQHFVTVPDNINHDEGILIRANHQSNLLQSRLSFIFPTRDIILSENNVQTVDQTNLINQSCINLDFEVPFIKLTSCSSVKIVKNEKYEVICRRKDILTKLNNKASQETIIKNNANIKIPHLLELNNIFDTWKNGSNVLSTDENVDENEIDLSDSESSRDCIEGDYTDEMEINLSKNEDKGSNSAKFIPPQKRIKTQKYEEDKFSSNSHATLMVLGTGCASPSPLRGSSGYALLLPTIIEESAGGKCISSSYLTAMIECGEGSLTTLARHLPSKIKKDDFNNISPLKLHLLQIRFIWISHAHLDHYGELPLVIDEINKIRKELYVNICLCYESKIISKTAATGFDTKRNNNCIHLSKCKKCGLCLPPLVIAPPKVLDFLDISTQCQNGIYTNEEGSQRLYFGITNKDFDSSPFARELRDDIFGFELLTMPWNKIYRPIISLKSVPVDHCPNAYALILGLRLPDGQTFTLCYSGDTRPSQNLIQACRSEGLIGNGLCKTEVKQSISLLLHEATFDDDERGSIEAIKKKHSTVKEAMMIAKQINANSCLLTHFSQRYPRLPPSFSPSNRDESNTIGHSIESMGSAFDGMTIPLSESILPQILPRLSLAVAEILEAASRDEER